MSTDNDDDIGSEEDGTLQTLLAEEIATDDAMQVMLEEVLTSSDEEMAVGAASRKGRRPNKKRDFKGAYNRLMTNYFNGPDSVYARMHITKSNTEITSITLLFGGVTVTLPYFRYSLLKMRTPLRY